MRRGYDRYDDYDDYDDGYVHTGFQNSSRRGYYSGRRSNGRRGYSSGRRGYGSNRYGSGYGDYDDQPRGSYASGYDGRYATYGDDRPSLSSRILCALSNMNLAIKRRRLEKQGPPPVKVSNVVYQDCVKQGNYSKYLLEAGEDVG